MVTAWLCSRWTRGEEGGVLTGGPGASADREDTRAWHDLGRRSAGPREGKASREEGSEAGWRSEERRAGPCGNRPKKWAGGGKWATGRSRPTRPKGRGERGIRFPIFPKQFQNQF